MGTHFLCLFRRRFFFFHPYYYTIIFAKLLLFNTILYVFFTPLSIKVCILPSLRVFDGIIILLVPYNVHVTHIQYSNPIYGVPLKRHGSESDRYGWARNPLYIPKAHG